jgi:hypothetical protein
MYDEGLSMDGEELFVHGEGLSMQEEGKVLFFSIYSMR